MARAAPLPGFNECGERPPSSVRDSGVDGPESARALNAGSPLHARQDFRSRAPRVHVRRIFTMARDGYGLIRIAKRLNAEHVPAPRGTSWSPSAVRNMLYRAALPRSDRVEQEPKDLAWRHEGTADSPGERVDDARCARAAHRPGRAMAGRPARMDTTRDTYVRTGFGLMMGKPSRFDLESPYLLSGMGRCGCCGGSLIALTRKHGTRRGKRYGCAWSHERGGTVCTNRFQISQDVLDRAVLDSVMEILNERVMLAAIDRALEKVRERQADAVQRATMLDAEKVLIEMKTSRLVAGAQRGLGPARARGRSHTTGRGPQGGSGPGDRDPEGAASRNAGARGDRYAQGASSGAGGRCPRLTRSPSGARAARVAENPGGPIDVRAAGARRRAGWLPFHGPSDARPSPEWGDGRCHPRWWPQGVLDGTG